MKKHLISLIILVLIGIYSCQEEQVQKQYFEDSPEIDIAKKAIDAYLKQDWVTYKSYYSDTAKIWDNVWSDSDPGTTIDENIEGMKASTSSLVSYSFEESIYEMIISNDEEKYVYFWGKWTGKFTEDGDNVVVPVHIAFNVVDNKIVAEYGFWDNLPIYLAQQALETEDI